jgi:Protein of unknown function (DUF3096)
MRANLGRPWHQLVGLVCGLVLMLITGVLPAFSSPSMPITLRLPAIDNPASWGPVVALVAGLLILMVPRVFHYIVAIYLILIGLIGLLGR